MAASRRAAKRSLPYSSAARRTVATRLASPFLNDAVVFETNELAGAPRVVATQEGRVLLRLEVAADGTASRAVVIESSGVASLDSAAQEAVERWRFVPAQRPGKAVTATVRVPVVFRLDARG